MWSSRAARSRGTERKAPPRQRPGLDRGWAADVRSVCVGHLVRITPEWKPLVDFPGNRGGLKQARCVVDLPEGGLSEGSGVPVLLAFENGDADLPVIVGIIRDTIGPPAARQVVTPSVPRPLKAVADAKQVVLDAKEEVVLRCGKGSITLTKDGKIVILGTHLVSRSSGVNKVKGASVKIN